MNLLNKLTKKNLQLNKKRTIVTVIGIMLSIALLTAVSTMYMSCISSLIKYEINVKGNYHIYFTDVDSSEVQVIENNKGVEKIYYTQEIGYAKLNDSQNTYKPYAYVIGANAESLNNLGFYLTEGRYPQNDNEILISTAVKTNGGMKYKLGDQITLDIGTRESDGYVLNQNNPYDKSINEEIVNTISKNYTIVGIIKRPCSEIEPYEAPGYTFITNIDDSILNGKINVYARLNKYGLKNYKKVEANIIGVDEDKFERYFSTYLNEDEIDVFLEELSNAKYQYGQNQYLIELETNPINNDSIGGLQYVALIVCLVIIVSSVFCIKNSFDISITEKTKQYGTLRSIGATKAQIKSNVLYEAFILGIIGIMLGIALGLLASYILIIVSNLLLKNSLSSGLQLTFSLSYLAIFFSVILGIITIYLSAIRSAKRASKVSPINSIRNSSDIKIKSNKLGVPKLISKLFGVGGEISYKNIKRNKKKYRVTVLSIIISIIVFISLSYFMNLFMKTVSSQLNYNEYNLVFTTHAKDNETEKINKIYEISKLDNINDYVIIRSATFDLTNDIKYNPSVSDIFEGAEYDNISIMALGDEQYKKYIKSLNLNYDDIKDKGILIDTIKYGRMVDNKAVYQIDRKYSYKKGDILSGIYYTLEENYLSIEIGAISDIKPFGNKNSNDQFLIVSDEYYNKNIKGNYYYELDFDSSNAASLQDDIDKIFEGEDYNLNNISENVENSRRIVILIGIFLYGFIIVITLIGMTTVFNTITTNMQLRKPEFAMLKSIGMTTKEFNRMIRLESIFMCIKSLLWGLPIGIVLSYVIYILMGKNEGFKFELPMAGIVIACIFVFVFISILMKYSINKINKQNTIETIRNENI